MSTLNASNTFTLLELAKRTQNKELLTIAEVLNETNEVMQDIPWQEANGTTSHKDVRRASLPTGTYRRLNSGVAREASLTEPIEEPMAILEAFSTPDKALIDMSPDPQGARMQEATAFLEGMGQNFIGTLFYGDSGKDPERFDGISPRLATLQTGKRRVVIGSGGTGSDVTSVYAVQWGFDKVFGIFPRGSRTMGIEHEDMGTDIALDVTSSVAAPKEYVVYRDHFKFNGGLVVKNPRCIGRVANIEASGSSNIFDEDFLIELLNNMWMGGRGAVIYVETAIKTQMEIKLKDKNNVNFTTREGLGGVDIMFFKNRPVRLVEQILLTEDAIT